MKKISMLLLLIFIISSIVINFAPIVEASGSVSARNAVLIEQKSGRILFQKNAFEERRIASITKIMTAILAIESGKLDEMVTVSNRAVRAEGSSIYLKLGEKIKLEDLVYGLMLRSGNDAAVAIAEHVGGSVEGFVFLMNQKAEEIGMTKTHFANPHGLDDSKEHFSTAYDMAILTQYAMGNPTYQKIAGTKVHRAPNPNEKWDRVWKNKNRLLTEKYKYTTGGKTGYTKLAKRTLVTTATKGDLDLIAVTLNAGDDWNDHIFMYESAFRNYDLVEVISPGSIQAVKESIYKKKIYVKSAVEYPVTSEEQGKISVQYKMVKPKKDWKNQANIPDVVGKAIVYFGDEKIDQVPIYYRHTEKEQNSIWDYFKNILQLIIGVDSNG
ncbi:D-alanyl-D-alanine carboxypeptidase [Bacillus sp. DNRA2]|uniref:D-alanyl-D-alanine carboxypeptidase family protein n=1 Tax=Bacillus sp. DNRA2 TaxID=2723053 RepID=UPI00145D9AFD|nr:D-alanyl-D-alanine carboxypeptidase family protein [Bacillus sp. DNRA2]NMD70268.1 D-alanyl-D-alanine carboxypeptidase [Bacillus sp. DNRA2]